MRLTAGKRSARSGWSYRLRNVRGSAGVGRRASWVILQVLSVPWTEEEGLMRNESAKRVWELLIRGSNGVSMLNSEVRHWDMNDVNEKETWLQYEGQGQGSGRSTAR